MAQLYPCVRFQVAIVGFAIAFGWPATTESAEAQAAGAQSGASSYTATPAVPHRVANPFYSSGPAAANTAATLAEPHVVYPAATTNAVNVKGLPRDRVAALGAAVSVMTLNDAYRAGVAAVEVGAANRSASTYPSETTTYRSTEPARFAPAANAARMPATNATASSAAIRRDAAVQPVAWLSDESHSAVASGTTSHAGPAPRVAQPQAMQIGLGNPLRRNIDDGPCNPLR